MEFTSTVIKSKVKILYPVILSTQPMLSHNETVDLTIKVHSWTFRGAMLFFTFINSHS